MIRPTSTQSCRRIICRFSEGWTRRASFEVGVARAVEIFAGRGQAVLPSPSVSPKFRPAVTACTQTYMAVYTRRRETPWTGPCLWNTCYTHHTLSSGGGLNALTLESASQRRKKVIPSTAEQISTSCYSVYNFWLLFSKHSVANEQYGTVKNKMSTRRFKRRKIIQQ